MPFDGVRVDGLRDLQRAFAKFGTEEKKRLRGALADAAEPVRARAVELADANIRNIGDQWDQMRVGVTSKVVYVAPKQRRRRGARVGSGRPNLAPLLMDRAMSPALEETKPQVIDLLDGVLGRLGDEWAAG
jgi:hypothetical protein